MCTRITEAEIHQMAEALIVSAPGMASFVMLAIIQTSE
jgi:hypothetical protein